ncbi:hypothetical protein [Nonomuraea candida]|uniref:hypothetical protein n=1 Tax=Nonomuraea candida TaxID=359159 RepID=UPI0005BDD5DF|nr:hypothetical protein [Nonomuraea candida]
MGEPREGLGTMADPAELAAALVAIGLLKRTFTAAEMEAEAKRAGGREMHRLELAHALAGGAGKQTPLAGGGGGAGGGPPAALEGLLQAAQAEGAAERSERFRQVAESLRGGVELAEELADKAAAYAAMAEGS